MKDANRKNSKKIVIGALSICLVAAMAIGGTMAFLTDSEQVTNHFSLGDLDITIDEPGWEDDTHENPDDPDGPDEPGDGEDLVPGDTKDKDPTVTAVEGNSYMRVVMTIKDRDSGEVITDTDRLDLILQTIRYAESDAIVEGTPYALADLATYNTVNSKFVKDTERSSDGVYYYNYDGIFNKDDTAVLFTDIVIPTDWNQTELNTLRGIYYTDADGNEVAADAEGATKTYHNYMIEIQAQAIQSDNFADAAAAFEALDGEITSNPVTAQKNYGVVGSDSDTEYTIVGKTAEVTP
ncbi:MAG: hypothetical protein J5994_09770 [Ruminococcus sp.]|nr:hypothetical protein [Ruminococcus sp.]